MLVRHRKIVREKGLAKFAAPSSFQRSETAQVSPARRQSDLHRGRFAEISCGDGERPELAGFLYDCLVSETADLWFGDAFFSALKSTFSGNGDGSRQRLGSNGQLLRRKPKHLVLAGPFVRQVGEADNSPRTSRLLSAPQV